MPSDLISDPTEPQPPKWYQTKEGIIAALSIPGLILGFIANSKLVIIGCIVWLIAGICWLAWKNIRSEKVVELGIGDIAPPELRESKTETTQLPPTPQVVYRHLPNLIYGLGNAEREVMVYKDENGAIIESSDSEDASFRVHVQRYQNHTHFLGGKDRPVGKAEDVHTELVYKFYDGAPHLVIKKGAWLNESSNKVTIEPNDSYEVILATIESVKDDFKIYAVERQFTSAHPNGRTLRKELTGNHIEVSTALFDNSSSRKALVGKASMITVDRESPLSVKITELQLWKLQGVQELVAQARDLINRLNNSESDDAVKDEAAGWEFRTAAFLETFGNENQKIEFLKSAPILHDELKESIPRPVKGSLAEAEEMRKNAQLFQELLKIGGQLLPLIPIPLVENLSKKQIKLIDLSSEFSKTRR